MKILMVDDDKRLLEEIGRILTLGGNSVDCVDNAADAAAKVECGGYDVVLIDYWMPEHNALWFMEHAKIPPQTKTLLMTSYAGGNFIKRIFDAGIDDYVAKPFDEAELLLHLQMLFEKKNNSEENPGRKTIQV